MNEVDADRYDLIFMDIQMSKMDGYMTTREIRTLKNNKKANIPIVAGQEGLQGCRSGETD